MKSEKEIVVSLRSRLTADRFVHSLNVADMARELARIYSYDEKKAYLAGLVHDCTKNTPPDEQLRIIKSGGIVLSALEMKNGKLWHALSGSVYIQSEYGIDDGDIISAVRYHTTGRADMTMLEKIIYVADLVSKERDYPGADELRMTAKGNLEKAVHEGAEFTVNRLTKLNAVIHPDTIKAMNYYKEA